MKYFLAVLVILLAGIAAAQAQPSPWCSNCLGPGTVYPPPVMTCVPSGGGFICY